MNLGLGISLGAQAYAAATDPQAELEALLAGKSASGMWDFRTASIVGSTLTATNIEGGAPSWTQATAANQPAVSATDGLQFDGTNDQFVLATGDTTDCSLYFLLRKDAAFNAQGHILNAAAIFEPGSGASAGAYLFGVDGGAPITTRGALFTALDDGAFHILARSGNLTASSGTLNLGRNTTGCPDMDVRVAVLLRHSDFPSDLAAAQAAAVAWLESLI